MFEIKRSVKLGETDAAGRLYFLTPLNWCQEAFEEFLLTKDYRISHMIEGAFQTPVVRVECDFKSSAIVGDEVKVQITNVEIKNSSFCITYLVFFNTRLVSQAKMTHVCVDAKTGKSVELPDSFKRLLV